MNNLLDKKEYKAYVKRVKRRDKQLTRLGNIPPYGLKRNPMSFIAWKAFKRI